MLFQILAQAAEFPDLAEPVSITAASQTVAGFLLEVVGKILAIVLGMALLQKYVMPSFGISTRRRGQY